MSFTPGPWGMGPDEFGNWIVYRVDNGQEIATVFSEGYEDPKMRLADEDYWEERMDADARLLTSAPELLKALKTAMEYLTHPTPQKKLNTFLCCVRSLLRQIEEGEEETE